MSSHNAVAQQSPAVEFKGSVFTLTILLIRRFDLNEIAADIKARLAMAPGFFENAPVVLDLAPLSDETTALDFAALVSLLRSEKLVPVGVSNASDIQRQAAADNGLALLNASNRQAAPKAEAKPQPKPEPEKVIVEVPVEVPVAARPTKVITQPVRSGQQVYAKGGDLIVLAAVNNGAEVIADGNIHIYAPLRGRALAGVQGDEQARIFCLNFGAEMVAIAGNYRVFEDEPSSEVQGKATQISLSGEKLLVTALS